MPTDFTINIKVSKFLKEYYQNNFQSKIILQKNSYLSMLVRNCIEPLPPCTAPKFHNKSESIEIVLPYIYGVNIEYNTYISDQNEQIIASELEKLFKIKLHNFIQGYIAAYMAHYPYTKHGAIKNAITDFCNINKVSFDSINFESLKKSYDRSQEKNQLNNFVDFPSFSE